MPCWASKGSRPTCGEQHQSRIEYGAVFTPPKILAGVGAILANRGLALDALGEPGQALESVRRARSCGDSSSLDALCSHLEAAALAAAEAAAKEQIAQPPAAVNAPPSRRPRRSATSATAPPPPARVARRRGGADRHLGSLTRSDPLPTHVPGGRLPPASAREASARALASALCEQGEALLQSLDADGDARSPPRDRRSCSSPPR